MPIGSADPRTESELLMLDSDALSHRISGEAALCIRGGEVKPFLPGFHAASPVNPVRGGRV
jgi:hypothetical protein